MEWKESNEIIEKTSFSKNESEQKPEVDIDLLIKILNNAKKKGATKVWIWDDQLEFVKVISIKESMYSALENWTKFLDEIKADIKKLEEGKIK